LACCALNQQNSGAKLKGKKVKGSEKHKRKTTQSKKSKKSKAKL
jgi:hypothetical protein